MIRCALLTLASGILRIVKLEDLGFSGILGLSDNQLGTIQWHLRWALPLWAVVDFNSVWKVDKSAWNWSSEIAVVTGGSAGIGACVAKKLASHGIKVAVLDIGPLSETFTKGACGASLHIVFHANQKKTSEVLYDTTSVMSHRKTAFTRQQKLYALTWGRPQFSSTTRVLAMPIPSSTFLPRP
jgi:hypothetical protein